DARNARRADAVRLLTAELADVPGLRPFLNRADAGGAQTQPAYYKVGLQLDGDRFGLARERFVAAVRAGGVAVDEGFRARHAGRSPRRFRQAGGLEEAERAHRGAVVLHHPVLLGEPAEVEGVVRAIRKVHGNADRLAGQ